MKSFRSKFKLIIFLLVIFGFILILPITLNFLRPNQDKLIKIRTSEIHTKYNFNKTQIAYGFLPYWQVKEAEIPTALTHLAYFGLALNPDGTIYQEKNGEREPGFHRMEQDYQQLRSKITSDSLQHEIVITLFDDQKIEELLQKDQGRYHAENLISDLAPIIDKYGFTGINIDIEYGKKGNKIMRQEFTKFVKYLSTSLKKSFPQFHISVSIYASTIEKPKIWDLPALSEQIDHFIIMAYDFHNINSNFSGPVAPLLDTQNYFKHHIHYYLKQYLNQISSDKLILGIPLYGYKWKIAKKDFVTPTLPNYGQTIFMNETPNENSFKYYWFENSLTPVLIKKDEDVYQTLHYENSQSINYKMDYAHMLELPGIAFWALGYQDNTETFWSNIHQNND